MAQELSQEALLDFLCQAGGRVTNAALLSHFKRFLRDPKAPPSQHQHHRELFKGFVNSVAAVRQDPDGTKYVVLKRRYRDLLGEEGLQRPCDLPTAAAPAGGAAPGFPGGARTGKPKPQPRRRRDKEREEEPAGAAAPVANACCNGLPASGAREAVPGGDWQLVSFGQRSPGQEAAQAGVRCAAAETQGRVCWECQQNSLSERPGGSHLGKLPDPANTREKPARTQPAQDDRELPAERLEGVHPEPTREPAASPLPSATAEAARSKVSPPALRPGPSSPGDQLELLALGSSHISILQQQQQQQQRTVEWVARHPLMPEDQGPIRTWSVLPEDFHQLSLEPDFCVPQTNPAPPGPPLPSHSVSPVIPNEFSESSSRDPPLTVFRSIRCQLSLQDLDDFVDEESHGSEESSSGPKDSPGGSEDGLQVALRCPVWENLRSPAQGISVSPNKAYTSRSPQGLRNREDGHNCRHAMGEANGIAGHHQESLPSSALKSRRSLRRSSRAGRPKLSSSDDELLGEDLLQRGRRPLRSRKPSKAGAVPSPRVDAPLTTKCLGIKAVAEQGRPHSSWTPCRDGSAALSGHRPEHKSSLVPLDAREHEWIVKLASGSWIQVLSLFWEEPQLALHRDFLTGYTALHWMAKHGSIRALQDLVSGAQKAGIALDVNVRSSCGYTPLHLAAIHGHQGVIKLLVQRLSSQVNIRDSSGKKPWQYLTSNTSGEIWQLLGAPRGKPIFPVYPLVHSSSPTRKAKSRELSRTITRKTSFAALLKGQHSKRKLANQYEKFHTLREREEYSD